jgi:acetyltransferase-like isoleucine patch superfamily enzyme
MIIKNRVKNSFFIWKIRCFISLKITGNNKFKLKGKKNEINCSQALLKNTKILINGSNNSIKINNQCRFEGSISIFGDNNVLIISENCTIKKAEFWLEDKNNNIFIGKDTTIENNTEFAAIEGCKILIGDDCMLSSDIAIRTGDSHSILNMEGIRINTSKDIVIGTHVWIGNKVVITKGAKILNNSIIGSGALVNKVFDSSNCILAGVPAKIIKEKINWKRERI